MNISLKFKKLLPYVGAIIAFIFLGYAYAPYTLQGKVVNQSDISSWNGMAHEIVEWNKANPSDHTLWTNSMFGGMPATTIAVKYHGDFTQYIYDFLFIGQRPASYLILSMIGAFLMFLAFGVNLWLAILGAIAVSFCSYNMQIIQVGHNTKMIAIAFMPWVIAALAWAYRRSAFWGALFFGFALSFQIKANHPQISYYLAIIVLGFVIWQLCKALKEKALPKFIKTSACVLVAGLLGIATNTNHLWPTYEYGQHTMRGGSELAVAKGDKTRQGLDLEYATRWSYGIKETPNLFIPNFNGGASSGALDSGSAMFKKLTEEYHYPEAQASEALQGMPLYWGPQDFTAGPMYMGAVCIFLCILGLFVVKGGVKWWLIGVSVVALVLSWGYHFMAPTRFFFEHIPLYNKFRTVSMILTILQITIPVLAVLALNQILNASDKATDSKSLKGLKWATVIAGGFALLFAIIPSIAGSFSTALDTMALPKDLVPALISDRISLLRGDALRSLIFVLLTFGVLLLAVKRKIKATYAYISLILLTLVDFWGVDKRYLNSSHFVEKEEFSSAWQKRPADDYIMQIEGSVAGQIDTTKSYRVLDLTRDPFNNAYSSYYHKMIGGYSPAKLQRYQDLIEKSLMPEMQTLTSDIKNAKTLDEAENLLGSYPALNMLNTRYIIVNPNGAPLVNRYALGNCWFVDSVLQVKDASAEMAALKAINPRTTAVIDKKFITDDISQFIDIQAVTDSTSYTQCVGSARNSSAQVADNQNVTMQRAGSAQAGNNKPVDCGEKEYITLVKYAPNCLTYSYKASAPKIALFSEVYYSPGWSATFTGKLSASCDNLTTQTSDNKHISQVNATMQEVKDMPLNIFRTNWILRGLYLPAAEGVITFRFQPHSFTAGATYSRLASGVLILLLICGLIFRKKLKTF